MSVSELPRRGIYGWSMQAMEVGHHVVLALSRDQLLLLSGTINEALEAVEDWEFSTRLGATTAEARRLQEDLNDVIGRLSWQSEQA